MDLSIKKVVVEEKPYKLLTYSNVSMFLDCPMKFYFRNILKIVSYERAKNLTIGSIFHDAIDMYYKNAKRAIDSDALALAMKHISSRVLENKHYMESNDDVILQGMVQGFVHHYSKSKFKIEETEILFDIPFNEEFHRCGKIDAFLKNENGQLFLGEWKSTSMIDSYVKSIQTSNQGPNYLWAYEKKKPLGVVFRLSRKSLLRQKKAETIEEFRSRILDDYLNRPEENFHDEVVYLDKDTVARWAHEVGQIAEVISLFCKENSWYRNTGSCWNYGNLCPYHKACSATKDRDSVIKVHYYHCEPGEELFEKKE